MAKPLISIVIAAYNVVEYLSEAIDSVIRQWDDDWELIVVNDGSTDGTFSLLEKYKAKINSQRFVVVNKENGGLSSARNAGLAIAQGEYVVFLDGDDLFSKRTLPYIKYCLSENKPDCLVIDFQYYWDDGGTWGTHKYKKLPERKLLNVKENNIVSAVYHNAQVYAWRHIFKKSILNKRLSPVGFNYEDVRTTTLHIDECETIFYLPIKCILYRQRDGSIMKVKNRKNILDLSSALRTVTDEFKNRHGVIPKDIALEHSIFNLSIFTWACGDTLSNVELDPKELYPLFVDNFKYSNLVDMNTLKKEMRRDPKTWRKFYMFYNYPQSFYLAFYLRHKFNRTYKLLNKLRNFVYKT